MCIFPWQVVHPGDVALAAMREARPEAELALDALFTLDDSPVCSGVHPEEQSQGIVIMPDEHVQIPQEV